MKTKKTKTASNGTNGISKPSKPVRGFIIKNSRTHIQLYGLIRRDANGSRIVHISKIHPIIKSTVRIPRKYQKEIIDELVEAGLLRKIDRDNYEILSTTIKPPLDSLGEYLWK